MFIFLFVNLNDLCKTVVGWSTIQVLLFWEWKKAELIYHGEAEADWLHVVAIVTEETQDRGWLTFPEECGLCLDPCKVLKCVPSIYISISIVTVPSSTMQQKQYMCVAMHWTLKKLV